MPAGEELAQIADRGHLNLDAVNARVDTAKFVPLPPGEHRAVTVDINAATYVGVAVPMTNSRGQVVAQIVGAFALSEAALGRMRADVLRTVAYVIAIILATALIIYPIIGTLLGRMSRLTDQPARCQPGDDAGPRRRDCQARQRHRRP